MEVRVCDGIACDPNGQLTNLLWLTLVRLRCRSCSLISTGFTKHFIHERIHASATWGKEYFSIKEREARKEYQRFPSYSR